ncbi:hypothetical protein CSKR_108607 [Clonorchis sinensis]|uniref:Uncharacterized protein n=1 Tax=Clonorchis sinensis TaxID=79923 RepID=A0A8T1M0L3_CLOSI|nr:hypothetical protein CSKR_108607 [Clonorchis sinensis]
MTLFPVIFSIVVGKLLLMWEKRTCKYIKPYPTVLCLVNSCFARSIPEYFLCMEECGEDPHEDDISEVRKVEFCRDKCNMEERNRCIEYYQNNVSKKVECWKDALRRCIIPCGDDVGCIEVCEELHTPPRRV